MSPSYEAYLEEFIDLVFTKAAVRWTWAEFAKRAGVSYSTVYNLGTYKTKRPQLRTALLLCQAAGVEMPPVLRRKLRVVA